MSTSWKRSPPRYGYPIADIGMYIQPIEHNRACQMEFTFFYDPDDAAEKAVIGALYREAAQALMNEGAFFSRPYGELAPMVYDRAASYTMALKRVKKVFDPKNIMNPGQSLFLRRTMMANERFDTPKTPVALDVTDLDNFKYDMSRCIKCKGCYWVEHTYMPGVRF